MGKNSFLLVEDSEDDLKLILKSLERSGVDNDIIIARDGAEALDLLFGTGKHEGASIVKDIVMVLLDIKLPKLDGIEVLKRVRDNELTKLLPVVLLTSSTQEIDILNGYKYGCNSYVSKPVEFEDFSKAVEAVGLYWLVTNKAPEK
jgi:two-component system response regulator